jgi:FkbM family methyltransferase
MAYRKVDFIVAATEQGVFILNRNDAAGDGKGGVFSVGAQLLINGCYEDGEIGAISQILDLRRQYYGDSVMVVDCGANIGVHTVAWAKAMHDYGRVLAIEPQERLFYALTGNIAINNCHNATALLAAVGAETGQIDIPTPDYSKSMSFGSLELLESPDNEDAGQVIDYHNNLSSVRLLTLDSLRLPRLDFLKIDVERMELDVLSGADRTLRECKPVMMIETMKLDPNCLISLLDEYGYDCFPAKLSLLAVHREDLIRNSMKLEYMNAG